MTTLRSSTVLGPVIVGLEGLFKGSGKNGYSGGIFDPFGLSK